MTLTPDVLEAHRARVTGTIRLDLREDHTSVDRLRRHVRMALDGAHSGDYVQVIVDRRAHPADVLDLLPIGPRYQVVADDAHTLHAWRAALGGAA
ncbi:MULTISPECIES: hypothetical protein [unclassified Microbacterium]|uniref:hypothetical protein n=1 Tax=unclassified Microbacterium TaxID=2609290 RepID=UPI0030178F5E